MKSIDLESAGASAAAAMLEDGVAATVVVAIHDRHVVVTYQSSESATDIENVIMMTLARVVVDKVNE